MDCINLHNPGEKVDKVENLSILFQSCLHFPFITVEGMIWASFYLTVFFFLSLSLLCLYLHLLCFEVKFLAFHHQDLELLSLCFELNWNGKSTQCGA